MHICYGRFYFTSDSQACSTVSYIEKIRHKYNNRNVIKVSSTTDWFTWLHLLNVLLASIWDRPKNQQAIKLRKPEIQTCFFRISHLPGIIHNSFRWLFIDTLCRQEIKHNFLHGVWCCALVLAHYFAAVKKQILKWSDMEWLMSTKLMPKHVHTLLFWAHWLYQLCIIISPHLRNYSCASDINVLFLCY